MARLFQFWMGACMVGMMLLSLITAYPTADGALAASEPALLARTRPALPTQDEIRRTVRELGHPLIRRRRAATRQLAAWGPLAFDALRRAGEGRDFEAALSARDLLAELESAMLIGAEVRLELDRQRVRWDEPINLTVVVHNPTPGPIRVPWPRPVQGPTTQPAGVEAGQVSAMFDIADFLTVTGPDDQVVELRAEPIDRDEAVYEVVNLRATGRQSSQLLPPGETTRLAVGLFNRGWARYPMLESGRYKIGFRYQPMWREESWVQESFGLVQASAAIIEIEEAAPAVIRRADRPLCLVVRKVGDGFEAELSSTWDRPVWINMNLGQEVQLQSCLEWRLIRPDEREADPVVLKSGPTLPLVRADRFVRLDPGERCLLGRVSLADLAGGLRSEGGDPGRKWQLESRYVHFATPGQLRDYLSGREEAASIPTHLFGGAVSSKPIMIKPADAVH